VLRRLVLLGKDESGQSLVFGVMTIFIVMFFAAMVLAVGEVTARRVQMQFAADSAAYSSALVEAECANAIALLNTSMAQVRARALRYVADVNAFGVLAELRDRVLYMERGRRAALDQEITALQNQLTAETDPTRRQELQRVIEGLQQLAQTLEPPVPVPAEPLPPGVPDSQRVIDIVGINRADLKYAEAYQMARKWVPAARQWLQDMSRLEHTIAILAPRLAAQTAYRTARQNGAEYVSVFPCSRWMPREDAYLTLDIFRKGEQWWRVEGPRTVLEVKREDCSRCAGCGKCGECLECWMASWMVGLAEQEMFRFCRLKDNKWFIQNLAGTGRSSDQVCIQQKENMYIVTYGPEGVQVTYHDEFEPRVLELTNRRGSWPSNTVFVRTYQGVVQYARYQWDAATEQWRMPTATDFMPLSVTTVNVDGVSVDVNLDPTVRVGTATVWLTVPSRIDLGWATIHLTDPVAVSGVIDGINIWIREETFGVGRRGYIIPLRGADGRWRTYFDRSEEYWWQHRLTEVATDQWFYEYMEFGARMQPETNIGRLFAHRDIELADLPGEQHATARFMPPWAYDPKLNPEGWMDARTGKLVAEGNGYKYYQQRPCWDPLDTRGGTEEPDGLWEFDLDGDGTVDHTMLCPTCGGTGVVTVRPQDVFGRLGQPVRTDDYPHRSYVTDEDYQEANFDVEHLPLVFSDEFFKYGTTVGVWHRRESNFAPAERGGGLERPVRYLLDSPTPGMKGLLGGEQTEAAHKQEILRPAWGYFAVAGARARLNYGAGDEADGLLRHGVRFDSPEEREQWVEHNINNLYVKRYGNQWSYWDARLVALSHQVLDEDVVLGLDLEAETGTGWLLKTIASGSPWGWAQQFDQYGVPEIAAKLLHQMRPRAPYPHFGAPYLDEEGVLRDPLVEYLADRPPGPTSRGRQLDFGALDEEVVTH